MAWKTHLHFKEVRGLLRSGQLTQKVLYKKCLKRAKYIKKLNAFISLNEKPDFKDEVEELPLGGIPISVKDNFCTRDLRTTCGSRMLADFEAGYNATVVQRLLGSGALLLGKTNMDEFAMGSGTIESYFGPAVNLWKSGLPYRLVCGSSPGNGGGAELEKMRSVTTGRREEGATSMRGDYWIAGGSSGGSALSVATGACFASVGSDTGGSVRLPAAHCGVVGFKPSYGTLSRHGLIPLANSLDTPGLLARTVQDVTTVFNIIRGLDPLDPTSVELEREKEARGGGSNSCYTAYRIGLPADYFPPKMLAPEVREVVERTARLIEEALQATTLKISLPHTKYSLSCYSILNTADVASNMARYDGLRYGHRASATSGTGGSVSCSDSISCSSPSADHSTEALYAASRSQGLGPTVRSRILAGNYFLLHRNFAKYYKKAMAVRRLICQDFERAWENCDFLLTPTTLRTACLRSDFTEQLQDIFTTPPNLAGLPAISLPAGLSQLTGLPIAVQLIAPRFKDLELLHFAQQLQSHLHFPTLQLIET